MRRVMYETEFAGTASYAIASEWKAKGFNVITKLLDVPEEKAREKREKNFIRVEKMKSYKGKR